MTQRTLFHDTATLAPTDPHVEPDDVPRLTGQNKAVLERLKAGEATSLELSKYSLNYRARIL